MLITEPAYVYILTTQSYTRFFQYQEQKSHRIHLTVLKALQSKDTYFIYIFLRN